MAGTGHNPKRPRGSRSGYQIRPAGNLGVALYRGGGKGKFVGLFKDNAAAIAEIKRIHGSSVTNPAGLVVFGNPLPAAIVEGFQWAAGSKAFDSLTHGGRRRHSSRKRLHGRRRNMTEDYRVRELGRAEAEYKKARSRFDSAKTRKQRLDADADLQFWGNKVAFLQAAARETNPAEGLGYQDGLKAGALDFSIGHKSEYNWFATPQEPHYEYAKGYKKGWLDAAKKKQGGNPKGSRRRRGANPDDLDEAKELFQKFHQREATEVFELHKKTKGRRDYTILGPLVAVGWDALRFDEINPDPDQVVEEWDKLPHLAFLSEKDALRVMQIVADPKQYVKDISLLASSPNGKQLYCISETPVNLPLDQFKGIDTTKDLVDLGEATFIVYIAAKPMDPLQWVHTFGEEGGDRPRLVFDRLTKQLLFVGGSYRVERPGIID